MTGLRRVTTTSSYNATLIFPPFAATAYRPDVHSTAYRCRASSPAGTILSREMRLRAGKMIILFNLKMKHISILCLN